MTIGPITFSLYWMLLGALAWRCSACSACTWAPVARCSSTIRASTTEKWFGAFPTRAPSRVGAAVRRGVGLRRAAHRGLHLTTAFACSRVADQPPRHRRPPVRHQRLHDLHVHAAAARDPGRRAPQELTSHFPRPGSSRRVRARRPSHSLAPRSGERARERGPTPSTASLPQTPRPTSPSSALGHLGVFASRTTRARLGRGSRRVRTRHHHDLELLIGARLPGELADQRFVGRRAAGDVHHLAAMARDDAELLPARRR